MPHIAYICSISALALSSGLALSQAATAQESPITAASSPALNAQSFLHPPMSDWPWARWNITPEATEPELAKELREMRDAGISGVELGQGDVYPSVKQIGFILQTANSLAMKVSLFSGPFNSPAGFGIDDDNARKTLVSEAVRIDGAARFSGQLPVPDNVSRKSLVAVQAYRITGDCAPPTACVLDQASRVDLTGLVTATAHDGIAGAISDGRLEWSPPSPGSWIILPIWSTGYMAQPDLLTKTGTEVLTNSLDLFVTPFSAELKRNGGDFFYDSHSEWRGNPAESWSNTMAADFQAKRGYSLTPYLPLLLRRKAVGHGPAVHAFKFDPTTTAKFRNEFAQVRTELWIDNHIQPFRQWAARYNQHLRVQPYGDNIDSIDQIQAAAAVEKPETETLWFGDTTDNYLPAASANRMLRRTWYSIEGSAVLDGAYAQSLQDQSIHLNRAYAGGVTQLIYHIYPTATASNAQWPGFSTFPNSFGNSWGPRSPEWIDAKAYNEYFARSQQVLKQGDGKADIAVFMQNYLWPQPYTARGLQYWADNQLSREGWTYDYLNPTLLNLPIAKVTSGVLAAEGPGYKALVIDGAQMPPSAASRSFMPLQIAEKIRQFARAGLPIIIVGAGPSGVPAIDPQGDTAMRDVVQGLLSEKNVHRVATEAEVPQLLARLGLIPSAKPQNPTSLFSVRRKTADTDFYWLFNQDRAMVQSEPATLFAPVQGQPVDTMVTLTGRGKPFQLNPWDGSIKPITQYSRGKGTVTVRVNLAGSASTIIALATSPARVAGLAAARTRSQARSQPRPAATKALMPADQLDLTARTWSLDVEDWHPAHPYGTVGAAAAETGREMHHLTLEGLKPWPEIPALIDTSGIGTYATEWTLPVGWAGEHVILDLNALFGSFTVTVNGKALPFVDQIARKADIGAYLQEGTNRIQIRVATNLSNRLRTLDPALKDRARQPYGLIGPVTLTRGFGDARR